MPSRATWQNELEKLELRLYGHKARAPVEASRWTVIRLDDDPERTCPFGDRIPLRVGEQTVSDAAALVARRNKQVLESRWRRLPRGSGRRSPRVGHAPARRRRRRGPGPRAPARRSNQAGRRRQRSRIRRAAAGQFPHAERSRPWKPLLPPLPGSTTRSYNLIAPAASDEPLRAIRKSCSTRSEAARATRESSSTRAPAERPGSASRHLPLLLFRAFGSDHPVTGRSPTTAR